MIQRFEFTYGPCQRMLLRYLEQNSADPEEIEQITLAALTRTGAERGLLKSGWNEWKALREARNVTSHTYNQAKADEVLRVVPNFLAEVEFL